MSVKLKYLVLAVFFAAFFQSTEALSQRLGKEFPHSFVVELSNPAPFQRENVMILLKENEIRENVPSFNPDAFVVMNGKQEIPSQYNKKDPFNRGIVFVLEQMAPKATQNISIRFKENGVLARSYPKRTQAELSHKTEGNFENRKYIGGAFQNVDSLRVPDEHTDHSYFIRYEGPGWESDKVGYRYYLDWRNATDVFGKTTSEMVLQEVGQDGFDSYHEMQPWGMDVLKVGESLGLGSLGLFHDGKAVRVDKTDSVMVVITENGGEYSSIRTDYYNWKVAGQTLDIQSLLSIHAGSRLTRHQLAIAEGSPENLATGLRKEENTQLHSSKGSPDQWGYLATYGEQSLNMDKLGLAVLFSPQDFMEFTQDAHSHIVKLKPSENELQYYFLAAWELEKEGIDNEADFLLYLEKTAQELARPVAVRYVTR